MHIGGPKIGVLTEVDLVTVLSRLQVVTQERKQYKRIINLTRVIID